MLEMWKEVDLGVKKKSFYNSIEMLVEFFY